MDHRTAITTMRTLALRLGSTTGRLAGRARHEVSLRIAARRDGAHGEAPPTMDPAARQAMPGPSPADVARAVARNAAGLRRSTAAPTRTPARRSSPGAKLPARAGQGILGV
ncbi:hypothetical protein [Nocardioides euryhalodurans]|uniref:Uncharacterized protein n=1 Tax=Nocardioides euryhalodurans TaxID=2518370 RepID=A0A4P7GHB1_9ACTN|nr:hypothetical protein [Nocardioides euryhalodurans]QBR91124.1 hypothetical protein EXE57_01700 [Nocardioides euryhalodurans]